MARSFAREVGKHKGRIGSWAFLIGVIIAVIVGLLSGVIGEGMISLLVVVLVIIGIVVGLLNVNDEETTPFLMSGAVLVIVGSLGGNAMAVLSNSVLTAWVPNILSSLLMIFVPATIIVAVKNVWGLAHD